MENANVMTKNLLTLIPCSALEYNGDQCLLDVPPFAV
jgi:hypothetical protein